MSQSPSAFTTKPSIEEFDINLVSKYAKYQGIKHDMSFTGKQFVP